MKIVVTPSELNATSDVIRGLADDYASLYNMLFADVDALQSAWQGKDNIQFTNQIKGFRDDFDRMKVHMVEYADFLKNSALNYTSTQDGITEAASRLSNGH